ncbi:MAG: hypothetical protein HY898_17615 [Deltaproteobacteria bacterium]|nr:hypothetical protein [Deltaproteobacteria bacterium]
MNKVALAAALSLGIGVGCVTATVAPALVARPVYAQRSTTQWEYECVRLSEDHTNTLNRYGVQGWELATVAALSTRETYTYCFKRQVH